MYVFSKELQKMLNKARNKYEMICLFVPFLAAFDEFAKSMDNLCAELVTKAEHTARELEKTR